MTAKQTVVGGGAHDWVWSAIASGDVVAVRAAPSSFDIWGIHPRYGSVLTCFLQGLLNLEGRFVSGSAPRSALAREIVEELGRRGARPDAVIPSANFEVKGLYKSWRLAGDITALQAVIHIRNDIAASKFESDSASRTDDFEKTADDDAEMLNDLVDRYAALAAVAGGRPTKNRTSVPDAVLDLWERCYAAGAATDADVALVSPNGERTLAHSFLLSKASPVVAAMLVSGLSTGSFDDAPESGAEAAHPDASRKQICVQASASVARLLLNVLYTGCIPEPEEEPSRSDQNPNGELAAAEAGQNVGGCEQPQAAAAAAAAAAAMQAGSVQHASTKAGPPAQCTAIAQGAHVTVGVPFMSNNAKNALLPEGLCGEVHSLDKCGDALIKFDGIVARQWVTRKNLWRLHTASPEGMIQQQKNLAQALALAYCWQIDGLADVLAERLERKLSHESFEATLEVAVLHNVVRLTATCLAFAQQSSLVRAAFDAAAYGSTVMASLQGIFEGSARKRGRVAI